MNARLYDPVVGRFLSPDPYIQASDFGQNFNRYSYALNNLLFYTDPNGEFIFTLMAALIPGGQVFLPWAIAADIGCIGNVYMNWKDITQNGFDFGKFGSYASIGAAAATGNPSLILASGIVSASAKELVAENYQFTDKVLNSEIKGGMTSAVTLGFSNLGFNKVISQRIGDFTLNFIGDFTTSTTSDAMFNDGKINWWDNFHNASFSAAISLGIDLAMSKQSIPADNKI